MAAHLLPTLEDVIDDMELDTHLRRIDRHRCRFCQCTEDTPCAIAIRKDRAGNYLLAFDQKTTGLIEPCAWYIPGVCTNPFCVQQLILESHEAARTVRMKRG